MKKHGYNQFYGDKEKLIYHYGTYQKPANI